MFDERHHAAFTFDQREADQLCCDLLSITSADSHVILEDHSVFTQYFDTDNFALYNLVASGIPPDDRPLQVRLRSYGSQPDGPVFFETKWQTGSIAHKRRITLTQEQAELIRLGGSLAATAAERLSLDPIFTNVLDSIAARSLLPRLTVEYRRRAFHASFARMTVDTDITYRRWPTSHAIARPEYGVLELKSPAISKGTQSWRPFTDRVTIRLGNPISKFTDATRLLYYS